MPPVLSEAMISIISPSFLWHRHSGSFTKFSVVEDSLSDLLNALNVALSQSDLQLVVKDC